MTINSCYSQKEMTINGKKFVFCIWVKPFKNKDTNIQVIFESLFKNYIVYSYLLIPLNILNQ